MALVTTLALLSLLTVLLVSFVSVVSKDRQSTEGYSRGIQADQIAGSALAQIVSQLQAEIADPAKSTNSIAINSTANTLNSTLPKSTNYPVYRPLTGAATMPERMSNLSTDPALQLIVKVSKPGAPFYTTTTRLGTNFAASVLTTSNSLNGRSVSLRRWDLPQLVPGTATNHFPIPTWVLLGRQGPVIPTGGDLSSALGNKNGVLGRYAYVVYDTSGLLDVNVAGYPNAASGSAGSKGLLPWADLTQLTNALTSSDVNALVAWRNTANTASYAAYVTNWATNGFLRVAQGDTAFLGRQELIKFTTQPGYTKWAAALPYLTTFSRELNGPVWGPAADATNAAGTPFDYLSHQYGTTTKLSTLAYSYNGITGNLTNYNANVFILNPRIQTTYTNNAGLVRNAGEPFVKYRFPLDKLALLEATTNDATWQQNKTAIQKYFGLDYVETGKDASDGLYRHWSYPTTAYNYGGVTGRILTLDEIASLQRDPNFFELLQAGILSGSLGLGRAGTGGTLGGRADYLGAGALPSYPDPDAILPYQIIRIGANVIDQWDSDSVPTTITFNGFNFFGIEDLPYYNKALFKTYSLAVSSGSSGTATTTASSTVVTPMIYHELWNPHQNLGNTPAATRPSNFCIAPYAGDYYQVQIVYADGQGTTRWVVQNTTYFNSAAVTNAGVIPFTAQATDYREPALIYTQTSASPSLPTNYVLNSNSSPSGADYNKTIAGLVLPSVGLPTVGKASSSGAARTWPAVWSWPLTTSGSNSSGWECMISQTAVWPLQFEWNGKYHTYSTLAGLEPSTSGTTALSWGLTTGYWTFPTTDNSANSFAYTKPDPRTSRWGYACGFFDPRYLNWGTAGASPMVAGSSLMPASGSNPTYYSQAYSNLPLGLAGTSRLTPYYLHMWAANTNTSLSTGSSGLPAYYADMDKTQRLGDAAYAANSVNSSHLPYYTGDNTTRPALLNRPFVSVAEMGYAFRDMPWRTLNFFSGDSPDAALLDLFSLSEGTTVAGHVNPNTAPLPVLKALLSGANLAATNNSPSLAASTASTVATSFRNIATNNPFVSRSDIVTRFMGTNSGVSGLSAVSSGGIKTEREAVVRAFAESANTRTWNLMIDIVAQSGRYPAGTTAPENFLVEGERRYWLHLAIDRYTGEIVDRQLEAVSE